MFKIFKDSEHSQLINSKHIVNVYIVNDNDEDIGYTLVSIETIDGRVHNFKTNNKDWVLQNIEIFLNNSTDIFFNF